MSRRSRFQSRSATSCSAWHARTSSSPRARPTAGRRSALCSWTRASSTRTMRPPRPPGAPAPPPLQQVPGKILRPGIGKSRGELIGQPRPLVSKTNPDQDRRVQNFPEQVRQVRGPEHRHQVPGAGDPNSAHLQRPLTQQQPQHPSANVPAPVTTPVSRVTPRVLRRRSSLMNTVATMGIAGNALCKLPLGILLDKFGPRATAVVGALMVMFGSLLLGPPTPSTI